MVKTSGISTFNKSVTLPKPVFAFVIVDLAWEMLLKSHPGAEVAALREIFGSDLPIAGGYSLGQIIPGKLPVPQLLNQHIVVVAFGENR
jgi:hypothetical protein